MLRKQGETSCQPVEWGRRYGINPLVTLCHSPYMLRKQGETILPGSGVVVPWGLGWRNPRLQPWDGGTLRIDPIGVAL